MLLQVHPQQGYGRGRHSRYAGGLSQGVRPLRREFLRHLRRQAGHREEIDVVGKAGVLVPPVAGNVLFLAFDIAVVPGLHLDLCGDLRRNVCRFETGQAGQVRITDPGTAQELQQVDILVQWLS